jgi:uncharacterized protein
MDEEPRMSIYRSGLIAVSVLALSGGGAMAASFNCARARAADERAICADRNLNDQDVRMALLFDISKHLVAMGRRGMLQDEQTDWLKGRRQCGANKQCLAAALDHRIKRLQGVVDEVASHGPF